LRSAPLNVANMVVQCFAQQSVLACANPIGGVAAFTSPLPAMVNASSIATAGGTQEASSTCEPGDEQKGPNCVHWEKVGTKPKSGTILHVYRIVGGKKNEVWEGGYKLFELTADKLRFQFFLCGSMHVIDDDDDPGCIDEPREVIWLGDHYGWPPRSAPSTPSPGPTNSPQGQCLMFAPGPNGTGRCLMFSPPAATPSDLDAVKAEMSHANIVCTSPAACETSCAASDQSACTSLGIMYWEGKGVPKNYGKGTALIQRACASNNKYACATTTYFREKASTCANEADCGAACDQAFYEGCNRLGDLLVNSSFASRAVAPFEKACNAGDASGCNGLASLYVRGLGLPRDLTRAAALFKKACDGGKSEACDNLVGITCIAKTLAPARRRPRLDPWCNYVRGKPASTGSSMPFHAFEALVTEDAELYKGYAGAVEAGDNCFEPIHAFGCTQVNIASQHVTAYCCSHP
jgi:hypothetical protein